MSVMDSIKTRGAALAGRAMAKLFEDEKRAEQIGELVGAIQRGKRTLDEAQEAALRSFGVASSGELKAASKRLARLRKSARQLDEKLSALASRVSEGQAEGR